jgi:Fusaric acid resistance protein-like
VNMGWFRWKPTAAPRAWRRVTAEVWPLLQGVAAAVIAWSVARRIGGHPDPFFAPIAAVIGLNAERGERGRHALRLLAGVFIGIGVAELTLITFERGDYLSIAVATLVATLMARAIGGARIVSAQAAASAILTVVTADGESGLHRLTDAAIGTGVALAFTQVFFSPEPIALLRRAEAGALRALGDGLKGLASALETDDDDAIQVSLDRLRNLRDHLVELARARRASQRVVRHSLVWRSRAAPVVRETENAGHLDLLVGSSVLLARTAVILDRDDRRSFAASVFDLASAVVALVPDPGDQDRRQRAADRALEVVRSLPPRTPSDAQAMELALRLAATDVMVFSGVDPDHATGAVRQGTGELSVVPAPRARRHPFWLRRRS